MNWLTIGSLTIQAGQVAIFIALLATAFVLWWKKQKKFLDFYGNAVFLFLAVWKLSILIFSFTLVRETPISLLYFNGGWKGTWLGIVVVYIYTIWKCPQENRVQAVWTWMLVVFIFEAVLPLINGQACILAFVQTAGGFILLTLPLKQAGKTIWLFTLWQLLFESLYAELFSQSSMLYLGTALFFTLLTRRVSNE